MAEAGWIIGNHVYDHVDLTHLTDQQILNELSQQINFLLNNGFNTGAYHLAYPGGYSNENIYAIMNQLGMLTGRTTTGSLIDNYNSLNLYQIPAYTIINTTPVSTIKGYINNAIETDSTVILLFHNIANSNPDTYEYLTSNFRSIIDYLVSTGIDCLTIDDLYQQAAVAPINIPSRDMVYHTSNSTSDGYAAATSSLNISYSTSAADIEVTNAASNYTPQNGENITLTITVKNNGPGTASSVTIAEWLNGNYLTWISDDSTGKYNPNTGIWTIGTLNSGATTTLHIIAKVIATSGTNIINTITYNPITTDPNTNNNNQTINLTVPTSTSTADIEVTNAASNYTPQNGENITLTITVKNNGPGTASSVTIAEWLNGNYLTWISDDSTGKYNPNTGIWTIGTLNSGATTTLHIIAKVIATSGTNIINTITYNPITTDPNTNNNNQTINLTVPTSTSTADIEVTNAASNYTPQNGENITLTITVKNNGPGTASSVTIAEWLNGNYLTWISDDSTGKYNPNTGIWTIGTLNSGATTTLHIIAKVIATSGTNIINTITYNPITTDPNTNNNNQTINLTVS